MNAPKCTEYDYINFLVAAQQLFSTTEAARSHPDGERQVAHDAYTRLLQRLPPDSEALWAEVAGCIALNKGLLILDDTTLDKPYASAMALVSRHWSGKHHAVVRGINLTTLLWTDGDRHIPRLPPLPRRRWATEKGPFRPMIPRTLERGRHPVA